MKIIQQHHRVINQPIFEQTFKKVNDKHGSFYSFECDKEGNVFIEKLKPIALANYQMCLSNPELYIKDEILEFPTSYHAPAIGICDNCGNEVVLEYSLVNECEKCGEQYNASGQHLIKNSGCEETGETFSDIILANERMY